MKICLLSLLVISFCYVRAQDTITCYFDEQLALTGKKQSVYPGKMIAHKHGWEAFALHSNGNVLMHGFFADKKLNIKHGEYSIYYFNGNRRALTYFNKNRADGIFLS
ncbi:MAG TPA: hypothetical protein PLR74_16155, partial [Agriterribacter sp.]|nr:hypothetical protein [Agriterribacter sp.]